ncbi:hypothetical protein AMS68_001287 [Peltaster fructicola]|uniref:Uncharacterized protein n=1 Tax=Peltaster fructicola TaxID=286661 RepID=A0A6H0XMQ0_9PEZI|nr:hypothetical protein AMS68_001287 [Peltaster fructicola]
MAATYFSIPSFARAKKNTDDLAKTNPKSPVLNDEDEKFLERITSNDKQPATIISPTHISDEGNAKDSVAANQDAQVVLPETQPADDPPESVPEDETAPTLPPRPKGKKDAFVELPSQEEAEAATKGFSAGTQSASEGEEKKTWSSYLPSVPSLSKPTSPSSPQSDKDGRTWAQYASSMVPSNMPSLPTLPASWTRSKDAKFEPVLNEDGSINEEASKEKEEKEVSVLLDNLNLSSINNRVFAFSEESQKLYERFVQALKDTMNGAPTAYEDMEKLMKEAGPTIERQWNAMPPFVQVLVKALPAKLSASMAPELLAVMSEKPGNDAKAMEAASKRAESGGQPSAKPKKKRQVLPGLKGLVKKQGLAATLLQNITTFLKTRFPFLMSATNVTMSLSVFILMFVFYYCWKRGREVRLAKQSTVDGADDDDEDLEVDVTDEETPEGSPTPDADTKEGEAPAAASKI